MGGLSPWLKVMKSRNKKLQEIWILCVIQTASTVDFFHSFKVHRKYILKDTVFHNALKKKKKKIAILDF